jgi:hypothetical protein
MFLLTLCSTVIHLLAFGTLLVGIYVFTICTLVVILLFGFVARANGSVLRPVLLLTVFVAVLHSLAERTQFHVLPDLEALVAAEVVVFTHSHHKGNRVARVLGMLVASERL